MEDQRLKPGEKLEVLDGRMSSGGFTVYCDDDPALIEVISALADWMVLDVSQLPKEYADLQARMARTRLSAAVSNIPDRIWTEISFDPAKLTQH